MGDFFMSYVGRPSKLDAGFIAKAEDYLLAHEELGDAVPSIAGLSVETGVDRKTLHAWARGEFPVNVNDDICQAYCHIYDRLMATQERKLLSGGLGGSMNATITKLMLTKHDYSDKVEQDNRSTDGSMSPAGTLKVTISRPKEK